MNQGLNKTKFDSLKGEFYLSACGTFFLKILIPIFTLLLIGCGKGGSDTPDSELNTADSEVGLPDSYFLKRYGIFWRRLDMTPITDPNKENQVLQCMTAKDSPTFCKGICISNTMKYADQERWDLMRTFYEGQGQCFLSLLAYDRLQPIPRFEQFNGKYYSKQVGGVLKGRCSLDITKPYFSGGYSVGAKTARFKSEDSFTWVNLPEGTAAATWKVRMYQEDIYTLYDPQLNDEITYHLHDTLWCVKKFEISQTVIDSMDF